MQCNLQGRGGNVREYGHRDAHRDVDADPADRDPLPPPTPRPTPGGGVGVPGLTSLGLAAALLAAPRHCSAQPAEASVKGSSTRATRVRSRPRRGAPSSSASASTSSIPWKSSPSQNFRRCPHLDSASARRPSTQDADRLVEAAALVARGPVECAPAHRAASIAAGDAQHAAGVGESGIGAHRAECYPGVVDQVVGGRDRCLATWSAPISVGIDPRRGSRSATGLRCARPDRKACRPTLRQERGRHPAGAAVPSARPSREACAARPRRGTARSGQMETAISRSARSFAGEGALDPGGTAAGSLLQYPAIGCGTASSRSGVRDLRRPTF